MVFRNSPLPGGMNVRLATWNVNSIRARLDVLLNWLRQDGPDVVCRQETKVTDDLFPHEPLAALGYTAA
jgi:exodeoxyribonuclease III